jgi:hypothetical protein
MKHIRLFESFDLDESRSGYLNWKLEGGVDDLAITLKKKRDFERSTRSTLSGIPGISSLGSFRIISPFYIRNVYDFNKFMEVFDIIGESPKGVFDLSIDADVNYLKSLKGAPEGFYVLRNSDMINQKILDKIVQSSPEAIFVKVEEIPLSDYQLKDALEYARAGARVYLQSDPDFFIFV